MIDPILNRWETVPAQIDRLLSGEVGPATWQCGFVAGAVWLFRVGLMGWVEVTGGIVIDWETFTGPFVYVLGFAQCLVPLLALELHFRAQDRKEPVGQISVAILIAILTVFMGT